jgi:hypothetical protein
MTASLIGWRPDELLVPALLAGSPTTMDDLNDADRAWVVVVMTDDEAMTADEIADRLSCSVRLVRTLLAGAGVALCRLYRAEVEAFTRTLDMTGGEVTRLASELADKTAECARVVVQRDRLIGVALAERAGETHRCGCPVTRYNTYVDPRGKRQCREHRRLAVARHRAKQKGVVSQLAG